MSVITLFLIASLLLLAGGLVPLLVCRAGRLAHWLGAAGSLAGGGLGLAAALRSLYVGRAEDFRFLWGSGELPLSLHIDTLAAFFLMPIYLLVFLAGLYGSRYLDRSGESHLAARPWFYFNFLALGMTFVTVAADSLTFLIAWELMSLASFFLVIHDLRDEQAREAGWFYLVATHLGTAFLFFFFFAAYRLAGTLDFAAFTVLADLSRPATVIFLGLILVGFGTKAGLFPMHGWLPAAHSAAPSHVSALMSGVMVKVAIYGFLRMLTFLPPPPDWAGLLIMALGIGGALFGIAMAVTQTDIKRTLAYSTVENVGIIYFGIGLWLYCTGSGFELAAQLALAGTLLHIWNHALFKSLLFMGAGGVVHAAGTREMSALGGIMRRMPVTGGLMIVGGGALAALPPLNGLVGELLIYLGLLHAGQGALGGQAFLFMILAVLLVIVGALVLLAMTRMLGIVFAGEPRRPGAERIHEVAPAMLIAMGGTAFLCLLIGLFPQIVLPALTGPMTILAPPGPGIADLPSMPFGPGWSLAGSLLALGLVIAVGRRYFLQRPDRTIQTWGCGFSRPAPAMSYSAGGFGQLLREGIYRACLRPTPAASRPASFFEPGRRFHLPLGDPVIDRCFTPLFTQIADLAGSWRRLQAGRMSIYLAYIFLTTLLLLGWNYFLV
jgi:formate hydrogenlyase subunit 3/multisubunit Na+/H+ antiporter MnhD subunit